MDYVALGNRIKEVRINKKITQETLAEITGLTTNYISIIERAKGIASIETIVKIANALEISMDFLFQDNISNFKNGDNDEEIISLLKQLSSKEKTYIVENIKLFKKFCRNLVDALLE